MTRIDIKHDFETRFQLTAADKILRTPNGKELLLNYKIRWAIWYLKRASLIVTKNKTCIITKEGKLALNNSAQIDGHFLDVVPASTITNANLETRNDVLIKNTKHQYENNQTPEEVIDSTCNHIRASLEDELLSKIKSGSADFFENLVATLIRKMGYGIDYKITGQSGDGGIDGIIIEDKLGIEEILFQAKKWTDTTIPIHQVRDFAGALSTSKSKKGIFVTSSKFSEDAYDFVEKNKNTKIILIDGDKLKKFMYDYNVGVTVEHTYKIKIIDEDFFE